MNKYILNVIIIKYPIVLSAILRDSVADNSPTRENVTKLTSTTSSELQR